MLAAWYGNRVRRVQFQVLISQAMPPKERTIHLILSLWSITRRVMADPLAYLLVAPPQMSNAACGLNYQIFSCVPLREYLAYWEAASDFGYATGTGRPQPA
jgi:hypothetical protein